ncbi:MAG: NEW3 domain-containing protein, partial [Steroidobacteraceae bacterium]
LYGVHLGLEAPAGWRVVPLSTPRGPLRPNEVATALFAVTPPSWAFTRYVTLYGTADLSHGASSRGAARHGGRTVLLGS